MNPAARKKTLRLISNGMYVVTSAAGSRYGAATITWLSQASFRPPLVMAAIRPDSTVFRCLTESGTAVIHILGCQDRSLAAKFFAPTRALDGTINGESFVPGETRAPILNSASAYLECRVRQIVDGAGDHVVVLMEVVDAECRRELRPLTIAESPWEYGG